MYIWNIRNKKVGTSIGVKEGDIIDLSPNPEYPDISPPSADLFLLHASIAKVLKISGRGEILEKIWRKYESLKVLAIDGSDDEILMYALHLLENVDRLFPNDGYSFDDEYSK